MEKNVLNQLTHNNGGNLMNIDIRNWHFFSKTVLCMPATSVPCERLLSSAGCNVNKTRSSLEPNTVGMLVCLRSWLSNGELLHGRRFPLRPKGAVYESYVRSAMLYGSGAWCLKES